MNLSEPKLVVSEAPPISMELPPKAARPLTDRFPLSVSAPPEIAVRVLETVNAFRSKAVVSKTSTLAKVPLEATNVTVPLKTFEALLMTMLCPPAAVRVVLPPTLKAVSSRMIDVPAPEVMSTVPVAARPVPTKSVIAPVELKMTFAPELIPFRTVAESS